MKTNDAEVTAALDQLDRALESPRVLAAKAVAEFRGQQTAQTTPWVNQRDTGAPLLDRDAVVRGAQPDYAPNVSDGRRRPSLLRWLLRRR